MIKHRFILRETDDFRIFAAKPHIRGLGEASATVAAVVAPRPGT